MDAADKTAPGRPDGVLVEHPSRGRRQARRRSWFPVDPAAASDAACFLDCLEENRDSDVPVSRAAHAVDVILAGYRAAATGETILLED